MGSTGTSTWPTGTAGTRSGSRTLPKAGRAATRWTDASGHPMGGTSPIGAEAVRESRAGGPSTSATRRGTASHRSRVSAGSSRGHLATRVATWVRLGHTIGIYGLDGVRQALLTVPPGLTEPGDFDPVWSPDGTSLVLPPGVEIPVDGSAPQVLPADEPQGHYGVTPSPDGSRVAYLDTRRHDRTALVVADPDGSHARVLIPRGVKGSWGFAWSPTADRIAFESPTGGRRPVSGPTELRVVDVATTKVTSLAGEGGVDTLGVIEFSPVGDQILFSRTGAQGVTSLWRVQADGSDPRRLVAGSDWGDWQSLSSTRSGRPVPGSASGRKK